MGLRTHVKDSIPEVIPWAPCQSKRRRQVGAIRVLRRRNSFFDCDCTCTGAAHRPRRELSSITRPFEHHAAIQLTKQSRARLADNRRETPRTFRTRAGAARSATRLRRKATPHRGALPYTTQGAMQAATSEDGRGARGVTCAGAARTLAPPRGQRRRGRRRRTGAARARTPACSRARARVHDCAHARAFACAWVRVGVRARLWVSA